MSGLRALALGIAVSLCPALASDTASAQTEAQVRSMIASAAERDQRVAPFRVFDNLAYVGIDWVSAWVLETSDGLILIDALYGEYVDHLLDGLRRLGHDPAEIRYVLVTHAHWDHLGGAQRIRELSGARIVMTEADWELNEQSVAAGNPRALPIERDVVAHDGESLRLGETTVELFVTPGHTPGVLSLRFPVHDGARTHTAFTFGGVGLNFSGVERTEMYIKSVERLQTFDSIEVNIPNHASMGGVFEAAEKLAARRPGEPHPLVDADGYRTWLEQLLRNAEKKLERERAEAGDG